MTPISTRAFSARWLSCAAAACSASLACGQCNLPWQSKGPVPGVYGTVYTMVEWDPDGPGPRPSLLVVGGDIAAAGSQLVNHVAAWDGSSWSSLVNGLPSSERYGGVGSLLVHDGQLLASGSDLLDSNGAPLTGLIRWTGAAWESIDQTYPYLGQLTEFNGGVAAAASVDVGGASVGAIVLWDGATWRTLGTTEVPEGQYGGIYTLATDQDGLLVGGNFTAIGGVASNGLARWDGHEWTDMGLATGSACLSVAATATSLVACQRAAGGTISDYHVLEFQGGSWVELPHALGPNLPNWGSLVRLGNDIYITDSGPMFAVGGAMIAGVSRLSGAEWEPLGTSMLGVRSLALFRGQLVAGGNMEEADRRGANGVALWNGAAWRPLGPGLSADGFNPGIKTDGSHLYACGVFTGDHDGHSVVQWNGHDWDWLFSSNTLRMEVYQGDPVVSAEGTDPGLLRFNGSTLEPIGPATQQGCVPYVLDGRLYAATQRWINPSRVWRLDDSGWTQLGPSFENPTSSLEALDGDVYMLGAVDSDAGIFMLARWDGAAWIGVGEWSNDVKPTQINSEVEYGAQFIASGNFWPHDNAFAVLEDGQWEIWPSPFSGAYAQVIGGELVALAWTRDSDTSQIVAFDGSTWRTLGVVPALTLNSLWPSDLQPFADGLVVAGGFAAVNHQCANLFARLPSLHCCGSPDFNGDGAPGTDQDIQAFFACLSGYCCPTCGSVDFNSDGDVGTDADIEAFFRVLAGGGC